MAKVVIIKTSPERVLEDYSRLMKEIGYKRILSNGAKTILKLNLSWTLFFPACSTAPWQLEGVLRELTKDKKTGISKSANKKIIAVENQTVVTHPWKGAYYNKWLPILDKYNINFKPLTDVKWIKYKPKSEMLAMNDVFKEILIPEIFLKSNIIHFPTMKTHGHTTTTGAIKNAFGGLIPKYRHHAHKNIHEILVDLLAIQKEIHKDILTVMDGCVCGNLAGPRTMEPFYGNIILASKDQVAIDAVAAKIMGFEPMKIDYIRKSHERGLGIGDLKQIEIIGMNKKEFARLNFKFKAKKSPIIMWDQILRKKTYKIKPLHNLLFRSPVFKSFIFASEFYHDYLWYPFIGKRKIKRFMATNWGKLFNQYSYGDFPRYKEVKNWDPY